MELSGKRKAGSEHRKAESGQREADNNISPRGKSEGFCEAEREFYYSPCTLYAVRF